MKKYFTKTNIVGVDLNPDLKRLEEKRISFICLDAVSENLPEKLESYKDSIGIIINDCSRAWGEQRRSFEMLFPMLQSGGLLYYRKLRMRFSWCVSVLSAKSS